MRDHDNVWFEMVAQDIVKIHKDFEMGDAKYNRNNLEITINNIKNNKQTYANYDAYLANLFIYERALQFMNDHAKKEESNV